MTTPEPSLIPPPDDQTTTTRPPDMPQTTTGPSRMTPPIGLAVAAAPGGRR